MVQRVSSLPIRRGVVTLDKYRQNWSVHVNDGLSMTINVILQSIFSVTQAGQRPHRHQLPLNNRRQIALFARLPRDKQFVTISHRGGTKTVQSSRPSVIYQVEKVKGDPVR